MQKAKRFINSVLYRSLSFCGEFFGLKTSQYYEVSKRQFSYAGAVLTFDLDSKESGYRFMNKLNIIRKATNLNDNKTPVIHPSSTIFCEFDPQTKHQLSVRDTMIRLAVGIEDIQDLKDDIANGFTIY